MNQIAKTLVFLGLILIIVGGVIYLTGKVPGIGKLPGDIQIKKENFTFYFPITTCLLVSLVVSFILFLIFKAR